LIAVHVTGCTAFSPTRVQASTWLARKKARKYGRFEPRPAACHTRFTSSILHRRKRRAAKTPVTLET
jgi:hypothetical protein